MTAPSPLLAASTERLAAALAETVPAGAFDPRDIAAYLIESGAVVPVASLADDEALWEKVADAIVEVRDAHVRVANDADSGDVATAALRALAAALEDR